MADDLMLNLQMILVEVTVECACIIVHFPLVY